MGLYVGNKKLNLILNGVSYNVNFYSEAPAVSNVLLKTSLNQILLDKNGNYITVKKEVE